jgi:hypothetical protein
MPKTRILTATVLFPLFLAALFWLPQNPARIRSCRNGIGPAA